MKWLYLILAVALLPLALINVVGVVGVVLGLWAGPSVDVLFESGAWGLVMSVLCVGFALRWWSLVRRRPSRGFPLDHGKPLP